MANVLGDAPTNAVLGIAYGGTNNSSAPTTNKFVVYDGSKYAASSYDQNSFSLSGHTHTDLTGTTSSTFGIDTDGTVIKLKNNGAGSLLLVDNAETGYISLEVNNLTVHGTTTTINSETLTIDDNVIVLNNNVTGTPSENAGIEIERGTSTNASLLWDETADLWKAGIAGSEVAISLSGHAHATTDITSGTLGVARGGTGLSTIAAGSVLAANALDTLSAVTSASGTKVLQNADGVISWVTGSSGDVTAASNLTDHAIIRGDGGGKGIQTSSVLIDDSNNMSGIGTLASGAQTVTAAAAIASNLIRTTSGTNAAETVLSVELESSGDMADGFGPQIGFIVDDTGVGNTTLGNIKVTRDGGDTSGKMTLSVYNAAAEVTGYQIEADRDHIITLGDAAGARKLYIKDSGNAEVAAINSDGKITCVSLVVGTAPDYTLSNAPTADRAIDYNSTTIHEAIAVLMTLISDFQTMGLLQ